MLTTPGGTYWGLPVTGPSSPLVSIQTALRARKLIDGCSRAVGVWRVHRGARRWVSGEPRSRMRFPARRIIETVPGISGGGAISRDGAIDDERPSSLARGVRARSTADGPSCYWSAGLVCHPGGACAPNPRCGAGGCRHSLCRSASCISARLVVPPRGQSRAEGCGRYLCSHGGHWHPVFSCVVRPVAAGCGDSVAAPARCRRAVDSNGNPSHHQRLQPSDSGLACGHRLLRCRACHCRNSVAPRDAAGRAGFQHAAPATGCHGLACRNRRRHRYSRMAGPARISATVTPGWTITVRAMSSSAASLSPNSVRQGTRKKPRAPEHERKPPAEVGFRSSSRTSATIT